MLEIVGTKDDYVLNNHNPMDYVVGQLEAIKRGNENLLTTGIPKEDAIKIRNRIEATEKAIMLIMLNLNTDENENAAKNAMGGFI